MIHACVISGENQSVVAVACIFLPLTHLAIMVLFYRRCETLKPPAGLVYLSHGNPTRVCYRRPPFLHAIDRMFGHILKLPLSCPNSPRTRHAMRCHSRRPKGKPRGAIARRDSAAKKEFPICPARQLLICVGRDSDYSEST